ncbi:T9SS type A sorting domain-containing protein [Chryseobacterium sp. Ch-15]|uniref:T9SS type A sorting domain-containing protein n=1 Tax=Chryseobacterium muglaense TaxID=2893752 RepID=A0A9Q3UTR2_9FLAO|nr:LamG-like jellyroll fold domain-containing protein [Chryseobacterium muglaense]MBD3904879.1 T9SS type A sorting domain-containing protein [Chryseobacterium muglaense]MCC9034427.1 T9SS type A sorting domain-containing protein [Chryseobacterium muglaense]MCM2554534.1 T9SS type A sorting domain-containing protein [Chryseobacterium muglaense]
MKRIFLLSSVLFSLFAKAQTPNYVPSSGLVAWWGFSGNAIDYSGNSNDLTVNGATLTADRNGTANSAYAFNGSTGHLTRSTLSYNFAQSGTYSISFWMKKNGNSEGVAMMSGSNTGGNFIWLLQCDATKTIFGTNKQGESWTWANGPNYSTTAWEHFVAVYNAQTMQLYKNGTLVATTTNIYTNSTSAAMPFYIGRAIGGGNIAANIDDVGIWSRALSTTEVAQLYSSNLSTSDIKATKANISIAPNPVSDILYVNTPLKGKNTYKIIDVNGRAVLKGELNDSKNINVSLLTKGTYFLEVEGISSLKFIKK